MIEGHGDDAWKYKVPIRTDFSSNVLYGGLDGGLLRHLQSAAADVTHYPEAGAQSLQTAAARAYGVREEEVLVTNGATEAIYLIAQAFRNQSATIYAPAFAEYEDACAAQGMEIGFRDWEELRCGDVVDEGLVFFCNPNNPTGAALSPDLLRFHGNAIVVIDESYIEFTQAADSVLDRLAEYPHVLVLRSLTKRCRIPGLRVGFVIGAPGLVERLRAVKMPWSVNRLALAAGLYVFAHPGDFVVPVDRLLEETAGWQEELRAATGWRVHPTDTHYFLIDTPVSLKMRLLRQYGLLVRDASNFRGLKGPAIRVACQGPAHNQFLTEALRACAQTGS